LTTLELPTIYVVDDDQAVRDSLAWLMEPAAYSVRGFGTVQAFIDGCRPEEPGCLLLDVRLPDISGLDLLARLPTIAPLLPVIIITGHADVPMALQAMRQGAFDFLEKPFDDKVLLNRIAEALTVNGDRRRETAGRMEVIEKVQSLTRRERQVMDLVVQGQSNREVAEVLGISPKTVEVYRARVMSKTNAQSLAALVRMLMRAGLI